MYKKFSILFSIVIFLIFLTGCSTNLDPNTNPINENRTGFWDSYFIYPLHWVILYFGDLFKNMGVDTWYYGLSIVVVTFLLRLLILPLMIKQTKSTKAMQAIQPELQKLREKYSAKDQKTQQKLQQETMKLFQETGVNPLAGCLPLFIQVPILLAFYQAIMRTAELQGHTFLWFTLSEPDKIALPIIAGLTTFVQQKLMLVPENPQMKMMMYIMPIMIFSFAMFFPAALTLYWVVGNIFMIGQTYFITGPSAEKRREKTQSQPQAVEGKKKGAGGKKK